MHFVHTGMVGGGAEQNLGPLSANAIPHHVDAASLTRCVWLPRGSTTKGTPMAKGM